MKYGVSKSNWFQAVVCYDNNVSSKKAIIYSLINKGRSTSYTESQASLPITQNLPNWIYFEFSISLLAGWETVNCLSSSIFKLNPKDSFEIKCGLIYSEFIPTELNEVIEN